MPIRIAFPPTGIATSRIPVSLPPVTVRKSEKRPLSCFGRFLCVLCPKECVIELMSAWPPQLRVCPRLRRGRSCARLPSYVVQSDPTSPSPTLSDIRSSHAPSPVSIRCSLAQHSHRTCICSMQYCAAFGRLLTTKYLISRCNHPIQLQMWHDISQVVQEIRNLISPLRVFPIYSLTSPIDDNPSSPSLYPRNALRRAHRNRYAYRSQLDLRPAVVSHGSRP